MATGSARDYQNAGTPGELLALSSRRDRVARANARDCQRTGERKPGNVALWPWSCQPGNSETARTPESCRLGKLAGSYRRTPPENAGDCQNTAGGWPPEAPETTGTPQRTPETAREPANESRELRDCRNAGSVAPGSCRPGERQPERRKRCAGAALPPERRERHRERKPERRGMAGHRGLLALSSKRDRVTLGERQNAAREPANESRKAAARGLLAGSYRGRRQRTPKLQGRRGMAGRRGLLALSSRRCARGPGGRQPGNSETTRTPGSYRPGDCWRYRPGVTAWPGGTPPENAKAARPPGGWPPEAPETARTPGRPGDGHRKRQRLPENRRTQAGKRCAVALGTPAGSQRRRRQRTPKLPPGTAGAIVQAWPRDPGESWPPWGWLAGS